MRLGTYYRYLISTILPLSLSGKNILDIGCFDGFLLSKLKGQTKTGIDIEIQQKYEGVRYLQGDFLTYDFQDTRFDCIIAFDVIEHIHDHSLFLKKIVELLTPNGIAILTTPSNKIRIFPPILQPWIDKKWGHHFRRGYSSVMINQLLDNISAQILSKIYYWNAPLFRFFYLPISIGWRINPKITKAILSRFMKFEKRYRQGTNGYIIWQIHKGH